MNPRLYTAALSFAVLVAALTSAGPGVAAPGPDWVAAGFVSSGIDLDAIATFESLLYDEPVQAI